MLGREALDIDDGEVALANFQIANAYGQTALAREPSSFVCMRDSAICWDQIGYARQMLGSVELAHIAYGEAGRRYKIAVDIEGQYGPTDRERAVFLGRFSDLRCLDGDYGGAEEALNESAQIIWVRHAMMPDNPDRLWDLAGVIGRFAILRNYQNPTEG